MEVAVQGSLFANDGGDRILAAFAQLRIQVEAEYGGRSLIFERFREFHAANPHVLRLLLRFADELRPGRRYGMKALFERVRWELAVQTASDTGLLLNNSYTAYYARLVILLRPALAGVFQTRRLGPGREAQVI